jgi:hypothetical protein
VTYQKDTGDRTITLKYTLYRMEGERMASDDYQTAVNTDQADDLRHHRLQDSCDEGTSRDKAPGSLDKVPSMDGCRRCAGSLGGIVPRKAFLSISGRRSTDRGMDVDNAVFCRMYEQHGFFEGVSLLLAKAP